MSQQRWGTGPFAHVPPPHLARGASVTAISERELETTIGRVIKREFATSQRDGQRARDDERRRLEAEERERQLADARRRVAEEDAAEQRHVEAQLRADLRLLPGEELI
jgi:hypothetical protein